MVNILTLSPLLLAEKYEVEVDWTGPWGKNDLYLNFRSPSMYVTQLSGNPIEEVMHTWNIFCWLRNKELMHKPFSDVGYV